MYARKAPKIHEDLTISEDLHPVQAIKDAMRMIEYAEAHSGHFRTKDRAAMKLCLDYLGRVSE